ncbi:MAG TPA: DinB family protein [Gemmatimonadales bacterium]|nr:DinB family protein [Gemmatimonadales bacterium]
MALTEMEFDLADGIAVLRRTPAAIRALLTDLPDAWLRATEGPDTWSPFDVLGHLIDGEETDWIPRARIILARGPTPAFEPFDRFRHLRLNRDTPAAELLDRFGRLRAANLAVLEGFRLTPADLALEGLHPELGRVTLRQLLATWVAHDLGHVGQIVRVMAKQYGAAVGPWRRYLPVLTR